MLLFRVRNGILKRGLTGAKGRLVKGSWPLPYQEIPLVQWSMTETVYLPDSGHHSAGLTFRYPDVMGTGHPGIQWLDFELTR